MQVKLGQKMLLLIVLQFVPENEIKLLKTSLILIKVCS